MAFDMGRMNSLTASRETGNPIPFTNLHQCLKLSVTLIAKPLSLKNYSINCGKEYMINVKNKIWLNAT
jgi:hypothetical protein